MKLFLVLSYYLLFWNFAACVVVLSDKNDMLIAILVGKISNETIGDIQILLKNLPEQYSRENDLNVKDITDNNDITENQLKNNELYIIENIIKGEFKLAEDTLIRMSDKLQIAKIVHEVYESSENNFGLLINFSKSISNTSYSLEVIKSLLNELQNSKSPSPINFLQLAELCKYTLPSNKLKNNSYETTYNEIVDSLKIKTTDYFIEAMENSNSYQTNTDVHFLADAIYDFFPEVFIEIMQRVVNEIYVTVESNKILSNLMSHNKTPVIIYGMTILLNKNINSEVINSSVVLNIASNLSKLPDRNDFSNMNKETKLDFEKLVEIIPKCARNIFFKSDICLWNAKINAYLIAGNSSLNNDNDRYIYTSPLIKGVPFPISGSWVVEKRGDMIIFKSNKFINEYIYAAYNYNKNMRNVFTWIPDNNTDDRSEWSIEIVDMDYCYIRNARFNEYLIINNNEGDNLQNVFTWKPGNISENSTFLWQFRSCD